MPEEIKLIFSEPEPLVDPSVVSFSVEEDVFCSYCKVTEQIGLTVLSPNGQAIKEFTTHFSAHPNPTQAEDSERLSATVVIKRAVKERENDQHLASNDLLLNIALLDISAEGDPVVVELNIDPDIDTEHSHIYTFTSRGPLDTITIKSSAPKVHCQLYDRQSSDLHELTQLDEVSRLATSGSGTIGFQLDKEELEHMLATLKTPLKTSLWNEVIETTEKTAKLNHSNVTNYALVIKGMGEPGSRPRSYAIKGSITIRE